MTQINQKLYWLPDKQRIHFKILLTNYKSINDVAPEYDDGDDNDDDMLRYPRT